jgi:tetratricopeptide (TPR) repeat protein
VEQVGADRFAFHDLLRDYARELAEAEDSAQDRSNAVRRILNWYLHTTSDASRVVTPARRQAPLPGAEPSTTPLRFSTYDSALHWLDAEQANLAGAIPFAAKTGHHDIGWRLSFALSAYFDLRKRRLLWIESHETALASARATGDAFGEAHLLIDLGLACRNLKRFEDAIGYQQQAITACHRINDRSGEAQTLAGLGDSYRALGRYDEAVSTELEALAACRANGDRYNEAWALTILGQIHREMRRAEEAIAFHEQAAAVHREVSDRYGEAFTLANLAASHQEAGQHADATRRGAEALAGAREVGDEWGTARVLTNLGQLRHDAGDHTDALACWTEAQRLFTATDEDLAGDVAARISRLGTGEAMSNRVI